jgi:hypothetical protein
MVNGRESGTVPGILAIGIPSQESHRFRSCEAAEHSIYKQKRNVDPGHVSASRNDIAIIQHAPLRIYRYAWKALRKVSGAPWMGRDGATGQKTGFRQNIQTGADARQRHASGVKLAHPSCDTAHQLGIRKPG